MKIPEICLMFHENLNHFSLSEQQRKDYASWALPEMLRSIQFPIVISLPAEDILYLHTYFPDTYTSLIYHPHTTFLLSTYSHVIAEHCYNSYNSQTIIGKQVLSQLIPQEKLSSIAYPSEVEPPQKEQFNVLNEWDGIILGETRLIFEHTQGDFLRFDYQSKPISVYVSRRNTHYRNAIHRYYREEIEPTGVVEALIKDAQTYAGAAPHISRLDLEVPMLNEQIYKDGKTSGPRIDLWIKLMHALSKSKLAFRSATELKQVPLEKGIQIDDLKLSSSENHKWGNAQIEGQIAESRPISISPEYFMWLSLQASDYLCTTQKDLMFKTKKGFIRIRKNQQTRESELLDKLAYLDIVSKTTVKNAYVLQIAQMCNEMKGAYVQK